MSFHMPFRGPFSRVYHDTGVVLSSVLPRPLCTSTDPSREILDNFFFSLRFDTLVMVIFRWKWKERGIEKRSGKFLVELMRRRDTKNHANES